MSILKSKTLNNDVVSLSTTTSDKGRYQVTVNAFDGTYNTNDLRMAEIAFQQVCNEVDFFG